MTFNPVSWNPGQQYHSKTFRNTIYDSYDNDFSASRCMYPVDKKRQSPLSLMSCHLRKAGEFRRLGRSMAERLQQDWNGLVFSAGSGCSQPFSFPFGSRSEMLFQMKRCGEYAEGWGVCVAGMVGVCGSGIMQGWYLRLDKISDSWVGYERQTRQNKIRAWTNPHKRSGTKSYI